MAEGVEKKGHDRKPKTTSSTKASGDGVQGSERRRMYPLFFKLQVLKSFREDPDCKGNQRATARKYGIHRRQVQKWLVAEQSLRKSMGQPDAAAPVREVVAATNSEEEAAVPDVEMVHVPEALAASPLTRDESASSDGIVGSSSSSSYSDEGPESPTDEGQPSLGFLVSVLNAFHDAPEWHGREAATAQKFGIKRWQLRRWLKKEADIRAEAAACSRYCGEGFHTPEYPRCDFSPADCTLPDQGACDLSPRCSAAHLDRVVPHASSPLLPEQQVCTGERCPLVYCTAATPSPPAHYEREALETYGNSPSPQATDGCLDFSMGRRHSEATDIHHPGARFYRHEDAAAVRLPSVEMQVRVLDLRKLPAEGGRACPGGRSGECCPSSAPFPALQQRADSCGGATARWPTPLPPPAHTPWPVAGGELRSAFSAVPPPAHCNHLYW